MPPRRSRGIPAYRQIALALQQRIDEGEWAAGGQLPTEPQLSAEFRVNRLTVRQAVAELERAGVVATRHGKGVFVTRPVIPAEIAVDAASQKVDTGSAREAADALAGAVYERVVGQAEGGTAEASEHLGVAPAGIVRVDTVIGLPGGPAGVLTSYWLDGGRFGDLAERWAGQGSLPVLLRSAYGVELSYDWRGFSAAAAGLADAGHLGVAPGHPLLVRDGVSVDGAGVPVYYLRRRFRGEQVKFVIRFCAEDGGGA